MQQTHLHRTLMYSVIVFFLATLLHLVAFTTFAADNLPDLNLTNVSVPEVLPVDQPTTIYASISNNSPISVTSVPVRLLDASGAVLAEKVVPLVSEYDFRSVELDWTPVLTGVYTIAVHIDPDNLITETSKINNRQEVTVTVRWPNMTWYVDAEIAVPGNGFSPDTAFHTIRDGLRRAASGDTVLVAPGIYPENIWVPEDVALVGAGAESTTIERIEDTPAVGLEARSFISGFTVLGDGSEDSIGIRVTGGGTIVTHNHIEQLDTGILIRCGNTYLQCSEPISVTYNLIDHNRDGIRVSHSTEGRPITTTFLYNTIADNAENGIVLEKVTSLLSYNIIASNQGWGILQFPGGSAKLTQNNIWGNTRDIGGVSDDVGTLSLDPNFQDRAGGDYRLSAGSPLRAKVQGSAQDLGALPFIADGIAPKQLTITAPSELQRALSWQPAAGATGYWVYLGTLPNVYTERYAVDSATSFVFPFLFSGVTYYPVVSSRSTSGGESDLSTDLAFSLPGIAQGVFEEDSPLFLFDDNWQRQFNERASGGAYRGSSELAAKLIFTVAGDGFTLLRRVGPDGGRATITVDGESLGTIEFYSPLEQWQAPATISGLGPGLHYITLHVHDFTHDKSSGKTVSIDQIVLPALHTSSQVQRQAIARVNEFRLRAGLMPARRVPAIDAGAQAHAQYLSINEGHPSVQGLGAHNELPTLPGFSGETSWERARHYGYTGFVGEDVHFLGDPIDSVDGWMTTVYHRNLVLCYSCTDAGYGIVDEDGQYDVLNMGSILASYPPQRFIYTYPANRQSNVPREWNGGEIPDPLPGLPRPVGYPISLYLAQPLDTVLAASALTAPFYYPDLGEQATQSPNWQLQIAEVIDAAGQPVDVYVLDQASDVPKYLAPDIVFLIAKRPLADNTTYFVHIAGVDSRSIPFDYRWTFATGDVIQAPDLAQSSATATPMRPLPGERVTVSVAIRHSGPSARRTRATITLPSDFTYVVGSAQTSQGTIQEGRPLFFDLGLLNGDATIRFDAQVANNITDPTALSIPIELTWDGGQLKLTASTVVNGLPLYFPSIVDQLDEPNE